MLYGNHPSGEETFSVPGPVYLIDDRYFEVPHPEEIRMERMYGYIVYGMLCGLDRLAQDLPTVDSLGPKVVIHPPEEILFQLFQRQDFYQFFQYRIHCSVVLVKYARKTISIVGWKPTEKPS